MQGCTRCHRELSDKEAPLLIAKGIFIYRDFGQPFVNGLWDVFDDAGWMVRFLVDVEWNVSWFVVWQVQVECDVKKVYYFLIGLDM